MTGKEWVKMTVGEQFLWHKKLELALESEQRWCQVYFNNWQESQAEVERLKKIVKNYNDKEYDRLVGR